MTISHPFRRSRRAVQGSTGRRPARWALLLPLLAAACVNPVGKTLYQPQAQATAMPQWSGRAPTAVNATTTDGLILSGWYWAPEGGSNEVLLFLPGRAGNSDIAALQAQAFARDGHGVLVASYRGYGRNPGTPSEQGLYHDGEAFVRLARTLQPTGKLFLFGDGLGAAVALRTAASDRVDAVVTLGAFDTFASFAPGLVRSFYADAFDNVKAIGRVRAPILIMHGRKDRVVPFAAAERLRAAAGGRAVIAPIGGEAGHSFNLGYIAPTVWKALDAMMQSDQPVR